MCCVSAGPGSPVSQQKISHLLQSPAVKFITHPEFFTVLHSNYVSKTHTQHIDVSMPEGGGRLVHSLKEYFFS